MRQSAAMDTVKVDSSQGQQDGLRSPSGCSLE